MCGPVLHIRFSTSLQANFDDVLTPADHVSRNPNDTYYVDSQTVLRCHTSAHQVSQGRPCKCCIIAYDSARSPPTATLMQIVSATSALTHALCSGSKPPLRLAPQNFFCNLRSPPTNDKPQTTDQQDSLRLARGSCDSSVPQAELLRKGETAFLVTGDVYRRDTVDATHYPCFHQMECVRVHTPSEWEAAGAPCCAAAVSNLRSSLFPQHEEPIIRDGVRSQSLQQGGCPSDSADDTAKLSFFGSDRALDKHAGSYIC